MNPDVSWPFPHCDTLTGLDACNSADPGHAERAACHIDSACSVNRCVEPVTVEKREWSRHTNEYCDNIYAKLPIYPREMMK
jgi:hypothetical protein